MFHKNKSSADNQCAIVLQWGL